MTDFVKKPYIFTASQNKGMDQTPFITRSQYINSTSDKFYIRLQHEEALNSKKRIEEEEIGYIAIGNVGKLYKKSTVDAYGWLQVKNGKLCDESGNPVQLRGMSSFWTNWEDGWKYANKYAVQELVSAWDIDVYRLAIGVDPHDGSNDPNKCGKRIPGNTGYAYNDLNKTIAEIRIAEIVEQCVKSGIYVIIDWHVHDALLTRDYDLVDGKNDGAISEDLIKQSIAFFTKMAVKYKNTPNVMFEIWNEPSMQKNNVLWAKAKPPGDWDNRIYNWNDHIRPYCETITSFIRAYGAKNIIIAPTECYDQRPQDTWGNALFRENEAYHNFLGYNILYSTHFYAGTTADWSTTVTGSPSTYDVHKPYGGIWQQMQFCIDNYKPDNYRKQVPFFVTEWGTSQFDGGQDPGKYVGINESDRWLSFLNENKISWCNWSISDKEEAASALMPGAGRYGFWSENAISKSGKYVRSKIREGRVIPRRD